MAKNDVFLSRLITARPAPAASRRVRATAGASQDLKKPAETGPQLELKFGNGRSATLTGAREDVRVALDLARANDFTLVVQTEPSTEISGLGIATEGRVRRVKDTAQGQLVYLEGASGPLLLRRKHRDFKRLSGEFRRAAKSGRRTFAIAQSPRDRSIEAGMPARPRTFKGARRYKRRTLPEPDLSMSKSGKGQSLFDLVAKANCPKQKFRPASAPLCIPFMYPEGGCHARAHRMCHLLLERGVRAGKIWLFPKEARKVFTKNAPDFSVNWVMHVATIIDVAGTLLVLDPSLFKGPKTIPEWAAVIDPKARFFLTSSSVYTLDFDNAAGPFTIQTDPLGTHAQWELLGLIFKLTEVVRTFHGAGPPFRKRQA